MNVGETYKDYYIKKELGEGANAKVWLAEKDGAEFALKFLLVRGNEGFDKSKFDKEVNSWKKANGHPNILTIHDKIIERGKFIIVLDYADGGSLKNKEFQPDEALQIIIQIISGIDHLHKLGLVHRDIKTDNILLRKGIPCLGDFGLARDKDGTQTTIAVGGSRDYFSPELAMAYINSEANQKFIYERTFDDDLWAAATVSYSLHTQTPPYGSLVARSERKPLPANFPTDLIEFFDKAFQKEKSNRFQSAEEMLTCLKEIEQKRIEEEQVIEEIRQLAREQFETEYRQKLDDEIISLNGKYCDEIDVLKEMNKSLESQILKRDSQISSWKEKTESFEKKIKTRDDEIIKLEGQIGLLSSQSYLEKAKKEFEREYFAKEKELSKEVRSLKTKNSKLESNAIVAGEELVRARNIIDDLAYERAEKVKLQEEKINLNSQLNQKNKEISNLSGQIPKKKQSRFFSAFGKLVFALIGIGIVPYGALWIYNLSPRSYFIKADYCEEKKDFDCVISTYQEAIKVFPSDSRFYVLLGDIYSYKLDDKDQNQDKAIEHYKKALEKDQSDSSALFGLGYSYNRKENYEEAIKNYSSYLEKFPPNSAVLSNLGHIYSNEKYGNHDYDKSIDFYKKATNANHAAASPYYFIGMIYSLSKEKYAKSDPNKAIENLNWYLEKHKNNNEKDAVFRKDEATKKIKELKDKTNVPILVPLDDADIQKLREQINNINATRNNSNVSSVNR